MAPHSVQFPDDLAAQIERLGAEEPSATFALAQNHFQRVAAKAADKSSRKGIKRFIQPANAKALVDHLPEPGGHTHCALRGDFVLCDIIPAIIAAKGRCSQLTVATLGMSVANADTLGTLLADLIVTRCHAKVICLPVASGDHYVIGGSANLRSSDNTEQMVIFNDAELCAWYRDWLLSLPRHG